MKNDKTPPEIQEFLNLQVPISTTSTSKFNFPNYQLRQENQYQVTLAKRKTQTISIISHPASVHGDFINKVTEIQFEGKTIKIMNTFRPVMKQKEEKSSEDLQPIDIAVQPKRKSIKSHVQDQHGDGKIKFTKKILKNILNFFQNWISEHYSNDSQLKLTWNSLSKNKKYNNNLIAKISKNEKLRQSFLIFIDNFAEEYINSFNMADKQMYIQALITIRKVCQSENISKEEEKPEKDSSKECLSNSKIEYQSKSKEELNESQNPDEKGSNKKMEKYKEELVRPAIIENSKE